MHVEIQSDCAMAQTAISPKVIALKMLAPASGAVRGSLVVQAADELAVPIRDKAEARQDTRAIALIQAHHSRSEQAETNACSSATHGDEVMPVDVPTE
jgi:hypothetical protein